MLNSKTACASKYILVFFLLFCFFLACCKKGNPNEQLPQPSKEASAQPAANPPVTKSPLISKAIEDIILNRKTWNPILFDYYGKIMPDFTVKDINDKEHKLSDYRGKNVMVVFWATWCVPCMQEVPHLVALREIMPQDKLAILAISNESANKVREVAEKEEMTYTVISYKGKLPEPFNIIRGIPTTFYIRPDGTLKLVVEGACQLGEMKAIILAE